MNLIIPSSLTEPKLWIHESEVSDIPELLEAGALGKIAAKFVATPLAGDSLLVQADIKGRLKAECGRCLDPLNEDFKVTFNLLIDKKDESGLVWQDEDDQGVEDYQASIGPDVTEIPLGQIIAEQVMLNYNFHPLPALDARQNCVICGRQSPVAEPSKKLDRVDPRWDKLKSIRNGSLDSNKD